MVNDQLRRIRYLAAKLQDRKPSGTSFDRRQFIEMALENAEKALEDALKIDGVTLASGDDKCPDSDKDCIPSDPPPTFT